MSLCAQHKAGDRKGPRCRSPLHPFRSGCGRTPNLSRRPVIGATTLIRWHGTPDHHPHHSPARGSTCADRAAGDRCRHDGERLRGAHALRGPRGSRSARRAGPHPQGRAVPYRAQHRAAWPGGSRRPDAGSQDRHRSYGRPSHMVAPRRTHPPAGAGLRNREAR